MLRCLGPANLDFCQKTGPGVLHIVEVQKTVFWINETIDVN